MCLIVVAYHAHPRYRLVVAANRDESFSRPTDGAHFWDSAPDLLAGRDRQAGGTWLGLTRQGRFGAVTNHRDPATVRCGALSRGELLRECLLAESEPREFLYRSLSRAHEYGGFNILAVDLARGASGLVYHTNSDPASPGGRIDTLKPGCYGLSNGLLDTPWPKLRKTRAGLERIVHSHADDPNRLLCSLLALMADDELAPDGELPDTGVDLESERRHSSVFITGDRYGTRSTTVLAIDSAGTAFFRERPYEPGQIAGGERDFQFALS